MIVITNAGELEIALHTEHDLPGLEVVTNLRTAENPAKFQIGRLAKESYISVNGVLFGNADFIIASETVTDIAAVPSAATVGEM